VTSFLTKFKQKIERGKTINQQRQQQKRNQFIQQENMTYTAMYIDGEQTMVIKFGDQAGYLRWEGTIREIKAEAARIITECPDSDNLTTANVQAIRIWINRVDAMVEAGRPVVPSILSARINFVRVIAGEQD
jgi:hypothetical protein